MVLCIWELVQYRQYEADAVQSDAECEKSSIDVEPQHELRPLSNMMQRELGRCHGWDLRAHGLMLGKELGIGFYATGH